MEKQMRAERERREAIIRAEGEKRSAILVAEGHKESVILEAEGQKQSAIRHAEGQSESIRLVQQATADGIKMLNESMPTEKVLALKSLDAFAAAADGKATKIIIPSDLQGLASMATSISEILKDTRKE